MYKIQRTDFRTVLLTMALFILLILIYVISISVGTKNIALSHIWESFISYDASNSEHIIIQTLRVPRAIVALAVGASFSVSGSLMQAMTRNPLASPSTLGINAGAGLGLALAMVLIPAASFNQTVIFSFIGCALASGIIFGLASVTKSVSSPIRLALVGVAISALFNAFSQSLALAFNIAQDLSFWNAGGIAGVRGAQVMFLLPWTITGLLLALMISGQVSILSLGEEVATGLGSRTKAIRFLASLAILFLTGSAVAIAGPIGFIGLVVPHGVRFIVGSDYKKIIPVSIPAGACLLGVADIVSRFVNPPFETPTGAVTALIGVPFFIYLASKKGGR